MSKPFVPKPIVVNLGGRKITLRADYPIKGTDVFPILMVQVDTVLHAFVRSGPPEWVNKTDDERRRYITGLLGPEYVARIVIHPDIELRLEMDNEHFIMRNREMVEVFSLKTSRLADYLETHDKQVQDEQPVVKQLLQLEHVFDDTIAREDVWNSKELIDCLDRHPVVDARHRMTVGAHSIHYGLTLRSEGVTISVNFSTDGKLFNINRGELRVSGCGYYYTLNGTDGFKLDYYPLPNKARVEQQAERLIRKLVDYIVTNSAVTVEQV
jgi:hypothetical protein